MFSKTKIAAAALAALVVAGGLAAGSGQAQAHWKAHKGFYVGYGPVYGYGGGVSPIWHKCRWVPQFNRFGVYVGSVKVCAW